jgi:heat shock protein HslJ
MVTRALLMTAALALSSCSPPKAPAPEAAPKAQTQPPAPIIWNLASVQGAPVTTGRLELRADGQSLLIAKGPCNSLSGAFAQQGSDFLFSPGVVTEVLCGKDGQAEDAFFNAIIAARRMESDGELMVLKDADGKEVAAFTRPKAATPALSSPPSPP